MKAVLYALLSVLLGGLLGIAIAISCVDNMSLNDMSEVTLSQVIEDTFIQLGVTENDTENLEEYLESSEAADISEIFNEVDIEGLDDWDTTEVIDMYKMFQAAEFEDIVMD